MKPMYVRVLMPHQALCWPFYRVLFNHDQSCSETSSDISSLERKIHFRLHLGNETFLSPMRFIQVESV